MKSKRWLYDSAFVKTNRWTSSGTSLRFSSHPNLGHYRNVNVAEHDFLIQKSIIVDIGMENFNRGDFSLGGFDLPVKVGRNQAFQRNFYIHSKMISVAVKII